MSNEENGLIRINNARLSFPQLVTPKAFAPGQPEKYSADFILEAGDPAYDQFKAMAAKLAKEKWADKAPQILNMIKDNKKLRAFGEGSERIRTDGSIYEGYEGGVYIGGNSTEQPDCYDANGEKLMNISKLYGGCVVNAFVKPWLQDNKFGKAIRCDLVAIQFVQDGESFGGGRVATEGLFQPVAGAPDAVAETADDYGF